MNCLWALGAVMTAAIAASRSDLTRPARRDHNPS
jgi:hypothetical protein